MKITYENDLQRGPGNGRLRCSEEHFPEGGYAAAFERASDHFFLGGLGEWGAQKTFLPITGEREGNGGITLLIGPGVVNQLDTQERYRVHLQSPDGAVFKAQLGIQEIIYSAVQTLNNTAAPLTPDKPEPAPPQQPEAEPAPPNTQEELPAEKAPQTEQPPPDGALTLPGPQARKSGAMLPLLLVAALLLLAGGGGAAWWFFLRQPQPPAVETPEAPSAPEQAEAPQPSTERPPDPAVGSFLEDAAKPQPQAEKPAEPAPSPAPAPPPGAEERVRLFFSGQGRTPEAAAQLSRELPRETPAEQDAVYRLYYFAGEHGEQSILLEYAACLDPAKPQWGSIGKDAPAAWRIYEKAKATQPGAVAAQNNLKSWLEQKAAAGDAQAALWLRRLP